MGGGGVGGEVKSGLASNTIGNEFGGHLFLLAAHFYIPLITESEVITGKSQTEVSLCQYIKAEV